MTYLLKLIRKFCTKNSIYAFFTTFALASTAYFTENSTSAFILFFCIWVFAFLTSAILVEENISNLTKGLSIIYIGSLYVISTHYINIPKVDGNELHNLIYLFLQINSIMSPMIFSAIGGFLIVEHIKKINQKEKNINEVEDVNKKGKGSSKESSDPLPKTAKKSNNQLFLTLCIFAFTYILFMFVFPFIQEWHSTHNIALSWQKVLHTLYDWQTLNSSIIALISAIIFYKGNKKREIGRAHQEEKHLHRNLISSSAFIPGVLMSINEHLQLLSKYWIDVGSSAYDKNPKQIAISDIKEIRTPLPMHSHESYLREYFKYAPDEITSYIVNIISDFEKIQFKVMHAKFIWYQEVISNLIQLDNLASRIFKALDYFRGDSHKIKEKEITIDDLLEASQFLQQDRDFVITDIEKYLKRGITGRFVRE